MRAIAPGKLILSGEHSVVYGQPALAMAINRYAEAFITPGKRKHIALDLNNLKYRGIYTLQTLRRLKNRLIRDYDLFLQGKYSIRDVLKKPIELSQFVLSYFTEVLNLQTNTGFKLKTHSTIPIGCGMGSSAATILSILYAIGRYLNLDLKNEQYYQYGLQAENLQHGYSSGFDLKISLYGGCQFIQNDTLQQRPLPEWPLYIVNSGTPLSTTGECVSCARSHFENRAELKADFSAVTVALDRALQKNDFALALAAIAENHRLLTSIDVVPEKVQQFIAAVEQQGMAAKICGGGAIQGDAAGTILLLSDSDPSSICNKFAYSCSRIKGEPYGLHAA